LFVYYCIRRIESTPQMKEPSHADMFRNLQSAVKTLLLDGRNTGWVKEPTEIMMQESLKGEIKNNIVKRKRVEFGCD
jgi:hypothetical protein